MSSNNIIHDRASALHRETLVIDGSQSAPMTPEHFDRLRRGGINALNITVVDNMRAEFAESAAIIQDMIDNIEAHRDELLLVRTTQDIQQAHKQGKIGVIMGLQNARPIMNDLRYLRVLHTMGIRIIQLTYNERNLIGDGCIEKANGGLSRFGRSVVKEMNRLGVVVDVSHCSEQTTLDAIEESDLPIAITHSNAKALSPSPRNKSDRVLKLLSERGGVIGAVVWAPITYSDPKRRPGTKEFFAIVDYLVEHAGIDHVGIGSDIGEGESREHYEAMFMHGGGIYPEITAPLGDWYNWDNRMVEGLESSVVFPMITEELMKHGYKDEDLRKIMGGNWLRIYRQVWDHVLGDQGKTG
jgi:membrane dipeptidase